MSLIIPVYKRQGGFGIVPGCWEKANSQEKRYEKRIQSSRLMTVHRGTMPLVVKRLVGLLSLLLLLTSCQGNAENVVKESPSKSSQQTSKFDLANIPSEDVYTFECELVSHKPTIVSTTCATLGTHVRNIKWTKWDATGAEGTGIFSTQTCDPSCAEGGRIDLKVEVKLDGLIQIENKFFLILFEIKYRKKMFDLYSEATINDLVWRLDEFYFQMNGRTLPDYDF